MPRPRRLHVAGGTYLLTLKGSAQQTLVASDDDREDLERLLALALKRSRSRAHAYCWLPDRLLLAVQISETPLGQLVQRFASPYALRIQQRAGRAGHLFARRYDATLVDADAFLLQLVRYVHRAPIRAGLAKTPDDYRWSSHRAYLGHARVAWLTTQPALRKVSNKKAEARRRYAEFVTANGPRDPASTFETRGTTDARIVGSTEFKRAIAQRTSQPLPFESLDQLIDSVCRTLRVKKEDALSPSRHRRLSRARAVITWHATRMGLATLKQVAGKLGRHPSTLSVAMDRYRTQRPDLFRVPKPYR